MQALIFFSSLGGLVILIWLVSLVSMAASDVYANQDAKTEQKNDAVAELKNNPRHKGFVAIHDAINSYRQSRETQGHQRDRREKVTVVLVGTTAIFALFAAGAAVVSAIIFQGQLNSMETDKQPWLDITPLNVAKDIVFYGQGAMIALNVEVTNSGKSPALNVDPWISPYLEGFGITPVQRYKRPDFRILDKGKTIVFPNSPVQRTVTGFVPTEQIGQALKREDRSFPVTIDLCVDYGRMSDPHKTCYMLLLQKTDDKVIVLTDPPKTISKESLKITYVPFGGVAY